MSDATPAARSLFAPTSPTTARDRAGSRRPPSTDVPSTPARRPPSSTAGSTSAAPNPSPHYVTSLRSRHSLYGTEDRVILDLGSSVWKAGFSGEASPRVCCSALAMSRNEDGTATSDGLWSLDKAETDEVTWEVREERVKRGLRDVWFDHLMTDPKARKVIVVENPLLPIRVKELIARILFENIQVPSLSFVSSAVLSLMAAGTQTGLVVDCGHLETTVLPVFASRPLFPLLQSSPRAGARLTSRLRALLLHHGSYARPPSSLNSTSPPTIGQIPKEVLTFELAEEIKTRMCFVGSARPPSAVDAPADITPEDVPMVDYDEADDVALMRQLEKRYAASSTATTLSFQVPSLSRPPVTSGVGRGWIQIPGWVRERAVEVLFEDEDEDEDERSLTELILETLLKLPIDLRKPLASSILVTGGTAMMPGFMPRLRASLIDKLNLSSPPSPPPSPPASPSQPLNRRKAQLRRSLAVFRTTPHFGPLVPLASHLAIINDPTPRELSESRLPATSGQAPAFAPSLLPWIGGSLAGVLKTGGDEIKRETWEEVVEKARDAREAAEAGGDVAGEALAAVVEPRSLLPDWSTRIHVATV